VALFGWTEPEHGPGSVHQPPKGRAVKEYEVEINGFNTTLQLSDADAEARGLKKPAAKEKAPPANKSAPQSKKADAG
jgi:hypothetical protein